MSRAERLSEIKTDANGSYGKSIVLAPGNLPWLANLAKAFERMRWLSCALEYRPVVGANSDGTVAVGLDWANTAVASEEILGHLKLVKKDAPDRDSVLSCTPCYDGPVWQQMRRLVVPSSRLQSRAWYDLPADLAKIEEPMDVSPGAVAVQATGAATKSLGEIWVTYRIQMQGTRKV